MFTPSPFAAADVDVAVDIVMCFSGASAHPVQYAIILFPLKRLKSKHVHSHTRMHRYRHGYVDIDQQIHAEIHYIFVIECVILSEDLKIYLYEYLCARSVCVVVQSIL